MGTNKRLSRWLAVGMATVLAGACASQQKAQKDTPDTSKPAAPEPAPSPPAQAEAPAPAGEPPAEPEGAREPARAAEAPTRIRIMAANLTSGNNQSYDAGHGLRLMKAAAPDIVLIQEFNYKHNTEADLRELVETTFGQEFHFHRESEPSDSIPNGIISRWPIIEKGEWTDTSGAGNNRDHAWARIDIPGPRDLWAVSVHLWSGGGPGNREREARELAGNILQKVPAEAFLVVGGDFNTNNRNEPALGTFSRVVVTDGPHPVDRQNNGNTNRARKKPYDHVLVDTDLRAFQVPTVIGGSTFPSGMVLDSESYSDPLGDIPPVRPADSRATNMQHMGVIKDFLVPECP